MTEPESLSSSETNKDLARRVLGNAWIALKPCDEPVAIDLAKKIPLGEVASLGAAFASMPKAFRTAAL